MKQLFTPIPEAIKKIRLGNMIIVVDDPISSLDSNSLYQAFSFLKNAVKESEQVFILTHNFDFMKLLINWTTKMYFISIIGTPFLNLNLIYLKNSKMS